MNACARCGATGTSCQETDYGWTCNSCIAVITENTDTFEANSELMMDQVVLPLAQLGGATGMRFNKADIEWRIELVLGTTPAWLPDYADALTDHVNDTADHYAFLLSRN